MRTTYRHRCSISSLVEAMISSWGSVVPAQPQEQRAVTV
jgi:hypothetical protein